MAALAAPANAGCAWQPGEVLRVAGQVESGGLKGPFERTVEAGSGRSTERADLGVASTARGFDGQLAWSRDMSGGVHNLNSDFARRLAISGAWLDGWEGCAPAASPVMQPQGERIEDGRRFSAWAIQPPGGVAFTAWYDAATGLLDRAFFQTAETRLIRHTADWREIGGGRFVAFSRRDVFPEDEDETVVRITSADVLQAAAPATFARPPRPEDLRFPAGRNSTRIAYKDDHRTRVYLPVFLNGKGPFLFELDNGGHNIVTAETAAALGLTAAGSLNSTGAGTAVSTAGIARIAEIRIGDAVLTDQVVRVRALGAQANDRSPGPPRAGILGLELFERLIVSIDRAHRRVTLSRFGTQPRPEGRKLPLLFTEDAPLVAGTFAGRRGDFMLDIGNSGPTIIEDYWAAPLGLTQRLAAGLPRGVVKVSTGVVGLGPIQLEDELVSYYGPVARGSEYTRAVAGIYGEPLLSRFDATYDYRRGFVWLRPVPGAGPLPFDRSGLVLTKTADGNFTLSEVTPDGPAARAGLSKGDTVSAVDGVAAASLSRADAAHRLKGKRGSAVVLTGTFGGRVGTRKIVLDDLLGARASRR